MDDQTKPGLSLKTLVAQPPGAHEFITKAVTQPIHMSATTFATPTTDTRPDTFTDAVTTFRFSKARR